VAHHPHQPKLPCANHTPQLQVLKLDVVSAWCGRSAEWHWTGHCTVQRSPLILLLPVLLLRQQLLRSQLLLQLVGGNLLLLQR
jgi:hypothetical protein